MTKRVLAYVRVSTEEQRGSGAGLAAQRAAILAECKRRGWHLVDVIEDAWLQRQGPEAAWCSDRTGRFEIGES